MGFALHRIYLVYFISMQYAKWCFYILFAVTDLCAAQTLIIKQYKLYYYKI